MFGRAPGTGHALHAHSPPIKVVRWVEREAASVFDEQSPYHPDFSKNLLLGTSDASYAKLEQRFGLKASTSTSTSTSTSASTSKLDAAPPPIHVPSRAMLKPPALGQARQDDSLVPRLSA